MTRTRGLVVVSVCVLVATGIWFLAAGDTPSVHVAQAPSSATAGCRTPGTDDEIAPPTAPIAPAAGVTIPGATPIDILGYGVVSITEGPDASTWGILRDPRASTPTRGVVARIDGSSISGVIRVVDGCTIGALASGAGGVWAGTCDPAAVPAANRGAEIVRLDTTGVEPARRIALPGGCVTALAVNGEHAWATNQALADTPPRLWRIDVTTGTVDEPLALGGGAISSLAPAGDGVWALQRTGNGGTLVLLDDASGAARTTVAIGDGVLLGSGGSTVWTYDATTSSVAARDLMTGQVTATTGVADLRSAAVGPDRLWFQQAGLSELTITIGRVAPSGTPVGAPVAFAGSGPDRTGLPFLADISATSRGLWLALQDRLFLLPA